MNTVATTRRRQNRRNKQVMLRERNLMPTKVARPLQTIDRILRRSTTLQFQGWQSFGSNILALQEILTFEIDNFPGFNSMASIADQYKVLGINHVITKHFQVGSASLSTQPCSVVVYSTYDKDGGSFNPNDIFSRENMKRNILTLNQPTMQLSGVPAYKQAAENRVVTDAILDSNSPTHPTFFSFSLVASCPAATTGSTLNLELVQEVKVRFIGIR